MLMLAAQLLRRCIPSHLGKIPSNMHQSYLALLGGLRCSAAAVTSGISPLVTKDRLLHRSNGQPRMKKGK